jgi:elongator complex protein 3
MNNEYKKRIKNFFKDIDIKNIKNRELQSLKAKFAKKYKYSKLPLTSDILLYLNIKKPTETFVTKPSRTLSGVTIISVMTEPKPCPGKCVFCPNYKNSPKSYTGFEPAAMRGKLNKYDPYKQIKERINQLKNIGHPTKKIELIIMGGTFPSTSIQYQNDFIIGIYQAITDSKSKNLEYLKKKAMISKKRLVGMTFETRPDFCNKKIIRRLLDFGGTRVEIGAQTTDDQVHVYIKRGHGIKEIIEATKLLKDSGFKVLYHMMIGLPGSDFKKDFKSFKDIFFNSDYCPDMIKIYPCLVTKYTELEQMYYSGEYKVYDDNELIKFIADVKEMVPEWIRIMRIQRDIPSDKIIAGIKKSNLREYVQKELNNRNTNCNCIRCKEPHKQLDIKAIKNHTIKIKQYRASKGKEYFISAQNNEYLLGFIRLRIPHDPFVKEIDKNTGIIRELHVYGQSTNFKEKNIQHQGIGKKLLSIAENIAIDNNMKKIVVISGIGVREYYQKQGYKLYGAYMYKKL